MNYRLKQKEKLDKIDRINYSLNKEQPKNKD